MIEKQLCKPAVSFDPYEFDSFFFGNMTREESEELLMKHKIGTFLLRCSITQPHGYSLSVRISDEGNRQIHHYFISSVRTELGKRLKIDTRYFCDVATLIAYYKVVQIEHTRLKTPAPKPAIKQVVAMYRFVGQKVTDLPFDRYEVLDILRQPEDGWWIARNELGIIGFIPTNYVKDKTTDEDVRPKLRISYHEQKMNKIKQNKENPRQLNSLKIPAIVRVIRDRRACIYDKAAMSIKAGETILLSKIQACGLCWGTNRNTNCQGTFPVTFVEWTSEAIMDDLSRHSHREKP